MSNSGVEPPENIVVGSMVTVVLTSGSRSSETEPRIGVVIEDYADIVIDNTDLGRDWAPVLQWAITLDDGRLVFAAEADLELA